MSETIPRHFINNSSKKKMAKGFLGTIALFRDNFQIEMLQEWGLVGFACQVGTQNKEKTIHALDLMGYA